LKEDKHFITWNRGFIATAHMHHKHLVLDANYSPTNTINVFLFKEIHKNMYTVLQENLKADKGKSLVSQFEATRDAQIIY
jgi:hypothetical protein